MSASSTLSIEKAGLNSPNYIPKRVSKKTKLMIVRILTISLLKADAVTMVSDFFLKDFAILNVKMLIIQPSITINRILYIIVSIEG